MSRHRDDEFTEFRDVVFGKVSRSGKAISVKFADGSTRWVPFSQMEEGQEPQEGDKGSLSVTQWICDQWADEKPSEDSRSAMVSLENVVALRETDKGLKVRVGDREEWLAKSQIPDASEVRFDGDRGTLLLPRWIAEEKGFVESSRPSTVSDDVDRVTSGSDDDIPF